MDDERGLAVIDEPYLLATIEEGEFEREERIANEIFDGLPDSSSFVQHPQGRNALTLLVVTRPHIGRGRDLTWTEMAQGMMDEFGLSVTPAQLRGLCDRRLDVALQMDADWFRKGVMQAAGNLNKAAEVNEVANTMKTVFDEGVMMVGEVEVDEGTGKIRRIGPTHKDVGTLGKAVVSALKDANELNAALGVGIKIDKAPTIALQQNFGSSMAEFAGVETPRRQPPIDAERAD